MASHQAHPLPLPPSKHQHVDDADDFPTALTSNSTSISPRHPTDNAAFNKSLVHMDRDSAIVLAVLLVLVLVAMAWYLRTKIKVRRQIDLERQQWRERICRTRRGRDVFAQNQTLSAMSTLERRNKRNILKLKRLARKKTSEAASQEDKRMGAGASGECDQHQARSGMSSSHSSAPTARAGNDASQAPDPNTSTVLPHTFDQPSHNSRGQTSPLLIPSRHSHSRRSRSSGPSYHYHRLASQVHRSYSQPRYDGQQRQGAELDLHSLSAFSPRRSPPLGSIAKPKSVRHVPTYMKGVFNGSQRRIWCRECARARQLYDWTRPASAPPAESEEQKIKRVARVHEQRDVIGDPELDAIGLDHRESCQKRQDQDGNESAQKADWLVEM